MLKDILVPECVEWVLPTFNSLQFLSFAREGLQVSAIAHVLVLPQYVAELFHIKIIFGK